MSHLSPIGAADRCRFASSLLRKACTNSVCPLDLLHNVLKRIHLHAGGSCKPSPARFYARLSTGLLLGLGLKPFSFYRDSMFRCHGHLYAEVLQEHSARIES